MSGIEVCAELRRRAESFNIPLALVSAADSEEDIIRGFTAGADEYMLKPIKRNEFLSKIKILVNKRLKHIASGMAENVIFPGAGRVQRGLPGRGQPHWKKDCPQNTRVRPG
jgi:DNA-binding response OmpR family regulator